jgi:ABC-type glycerol-3-phosphate transport system substrate-binding protein
LIAQHGPVAPGCEYLGKIDGHWRAVPGSYGSYAAPACARIDYLRDLAGFDVQKMYPGPAGAADPSLQAAWTWDNFIVAAERCAKGGHPFAIGLGPCSDAVDMTGAVFAAFGAHPLDKDGAVTVKSERTRQALEWFQKLAKTLPDAVYAYDDGSNDQALISGRGALIFNPPSAYATARRDAPAVAAQLWTLPAPTGPEGRYDPAGYYYWGIWNFSPNIAAAKALLAYLATREVQERLVAASHGYDVPPFQSWLDFTTWAEEGPPPGTLYNYPPRGEVAATVAGYPAPPKIAARVYADATLVRMIAMCTRDGKSIDEAMGWAEAQIEGFTRS